MIMLILKFDRTRLSKIRRVIRHKTKKNIGGRNIYDIVKVTEDFNSTNETKMSIIKQNI